MCFFDKTTTNIGSDSKSDDELGSDGNKLRIHDRLCHDIGEHVLRWTVPQHDLILKRPYYSRIGSGI